MADNKKNKGLGIPQTRGSFQVRGKVSGAKKEKFFMEKKTKTIMATANTTNTSFGKTTALNFKFKILKHIKKIPLPT